MSSHPLWPSGLPEPAPAGLRERSDHGAVVGVTTPRLEVVRPPPAICIGRAVLVIPGGSYQQVALNIAPSSLSQSLVGQGFTVCVLIYRLPSEGWKARGLAPLQDAQRAIRTIRAFAGRWGIDPDRIGLIGFSAGGHLSGMLATQHSVATYPQTDAIDDLSARPFYAGLIYPLISLDDAITHATSKANLLGEHPDAETIMAFSVDRQVTPDTPPIFLVHAMDDSIALPYHTLLMAAALANAGVRSEVHLFQSGGHAFGTSPSTTASAWPDLFLRWRETLDPSRNGL